MKKGITINKEHNTLTKDDFILFLKKTKPTTPNITIKIYGSILLTVQERFRSKKIFSINKNREVELPYLIFYSSNYLITQVVVEDAEPAVAEVVPSSQEAFALFFVSLIVVEETAVPVEVPLVVVVVHSQV